MSGGIFINIILIVTILAIFALIGVLIFRKLHENEGLKYEFITIIAHKFRTPLTHIKWSSESLVSDEKEPYKKQALSDIRDSNEKLIGLTNTLIELTDKTDNTKSAYHRERINLCELTRMCTEASKKLFHEKNIFISLTCIEPDIFIEADRSRMEFVLSTILENACSYSPTGRNITVAISVDHKMAAVSVTDDGIGIDPHDMPHIFIKFFRTKQARAMDTEGLGVALYLAKAIVRRHKGRIEAYSEGLDKGSTFSVILPRVK